MNDSQVYAPRLERRIARHSLRGVDHAVSEWGDADAPLVVYLHGWGDCAATFQFVVDAFEHDWHVVAPDFRGFGDSVADVASYWFPDYIADLAALLDKLSPDEPVRFIGHSMGANVAGLYAGSFPERIRAFANVEGFGLRDADPGDAPGRYRQWIEAANAAPGFATYASFDELAAKINRRNPAMDTDKAAFVARCWARSGDGQVVLRADPKHKLPNPVLYRRAESEACWRNVDAPVLLVAGAQSPFADAVDERLGTGSLGLPFPNAETAVIEAAGHMMHFEAPGALAATLERFLRRFL
ncbi:MAG: alpha/beta hydrolase [Woeseiaceae bacterium]|nr:alpha/beta hydrolase [Woeseiaceae bacterium]